VAVTAMLAVCGRGTPVAAEGPAGGTGFDQGSVAAWVERYGGGRLGGASCTWTPPGDGATRPEDVARVDAAGVQWLLWVRVCDGETTGVWVPVVAPAVLGSLAVDAVRRLLPAPVPGFSPAGHGVTQVATWFWTDPASWRPVTAAVAVPGARAEATAVPVGLRFDPGDGPHGDGPVRCAGPGTPWRDGLAEDASPCAATYRHTPAVAGRRAWPASVSIEWRISSIVLGGPGPGGTATTTVATPLSVVELHALLVR
jgi:hypothetical protein